MNTQPEATRITCLCPNCQREKSHVQVALPKGSHFDDTQSGNIKEFLASFLSGLGGVRDLDEVLQEYHLICESCGHRHRDDRNTI